MSRSLVICIDGTNNYPSGGYTNVQRLCRILVRDDAQQTYYQPGVGTIEPNSMATRIGRRAAMLLDSASAIMLERHVCSAYRYLMEQYRPGDQLYFFGFSRGAFAARVLAGMLSKVGLLHVGFDEMVRFAWETYISRRKPDAAEDFRANYCREIGEIRFLGLFDTVSAVGLPWVPKVFPRTYDNLSVTVVRHAQALDERRVMFVQNSWTSAPNPNMLGRTTDVRQIWFTGVHSDVGGGYAESEGGLSRIPLVWMIEEAQAQGLRFDPALRASVLDPTAPPETVRTIESVSRAFAHAPAHDELTRQRAWYALEYLPVPRRRHDPTTDTWSTEWIVNRARPRHPPHGLLVHKSVEMRMSGGYRPLPLLVDPTYVWK
jgi:uncharacterized protein (DUF2235 family)